MEILIDEITEDGLTINFENPAKDFPVLLEIEGNFDTSVYLPCSRCLQPFKTSLKSHFKLTFMRRTADIIDDAEPQETELNAEDVGIVYFHGEKIDLKNTIQEQVIMEFPLRALCSQDCKGLCTQCGADLNEGSCDCGRRSSSGKFAVLKNLKL